MKTPSSFPKQKYRDRWGIEAAKDDLFLHPKAENWLKFLRLTGELPIEMRRVGWTGIGFTREQQDTLAAHSFTGALKTLIVSLYLEEHDVKFDVRRTLHMFPLHDVSEINGGDIGTPRAAIYPELKQASRDIEGFTNSDLQKLLSNEPLATKFRDLTREEQEQKTDESKLIKFVDRIEALFHLFRIHPQPYNDKNDQYFKPIITSIESEGMQKYLQLFVDAFTEAHKRGDLSRRELTDIHDEDNEERRLVLMCKDLQGVKHIDRTSWTWAGLKKHEIDTIAEHGHATNIATWLLGEVLQETGVQVDTRKLMSLSLVQDLGKLYGGDVSVASRDKFDERRQASYKIRDITVKIITDNLGKTKLSETVRALHDERLERNSDHNIVVMIASRIMDLVHFDLVQRPNYGDSYRDFVDDKIIALIHSIEDKELQKHMLCLARKWIFFIEQGTLRHSGHALLGGDGRHYIK
ncbi:MAG: hypothetical protein A2V81_01010 [Candidatus Abawacabacteria bacterium RBG_16_42_10]|uniref:HD domain-containing protein n=1 Tax=Candidatus Abawacabacteria bacterium RBG_16_42_10 TaxID=1817814 RepID=A0A1F4XLJ5_9BACT|nr:MAG: hypothetical protein A2V81_01010 [Candidatus Abawacabacteria bacterium RBG_16_42_10]